MSSDAQILAPPGVSREEADPRRWVALVVLLLAGFMNLLDVSIVNIAIPSIQVSLHASYADVQWALAGYTLAYALVLITGGRLGDIFGRKRLFLIGVIGFTVMSALCGAAQDPGMLIGSRVAQGALGGIMIPQILAVIQVTFPPAERIKAFAGYGVIAGLGVVSGPLLGGLLVTHSILGLGWRSIFLINVPVGIIAVAAAVAVVRESRAPRRARLDLGGLVLVTVAILALLYPLVQGRELGWPAWTFASMGASVPVFALFVAYELAKGRRDGSPLVELRMFRERAFAVGVAIGVTFFLGVASFGDAGRGRGIAAGTQVRPRCHDDRGAGHGGRNGRPDRHCAPLRHQRDDLGHGSRSRRGGARHGRGARAAHRHPARRGPRAGRRIRVRGAQHVLPAR